MSRTIEQVVELKDKLGANKEEWCSCIDDATLVSGLLMCRSCEHTERLQAELTELIHKLSDIEDDAQEMRDYERNRADEAYYDLKADLDSERYSNV